ncbi:hypothetical protein DDB_G0267332 [Dictyostelium discoideum AX4]|uniref:Uncharacterized protein n=1 Tax=Dictyostelium discoideum TaxID=44689 RepID=Q55GZ0_DICDI|nr:hypothetical protein DDB_G0267332 [Dictyostelium discoideum AX4]EAL73772.1 hypothetical protein DDB_G0267332 [Dictyostelium discoideum AX4]|eukprot:XP_647697.1 hypothetical protein DDB_G0267332 [Dictyostelium discoideum AX4]
MYVAHSGLEPPTITWIGVQFPVQALMSPALIFKSIIISTFKSVELWSVIMAVKFSTLPAAQTITGQEIVAISQLNEDGRLALRKATLGDIIALAGGGGGNGGLPDIEEVIQGGVVTAAEINDIVKDVFTAPKGQFIQAYGNGALGPTIQNATLIAYMEDGGTPIILNMMAGPASDS